MDQQRIQIFDTTLRDGEQAPGFSLRTEEKLQLARQIDVPANRMSQIINGKRAVTGDTALRLGHWFKIDPQFWMNLQAQFELVTAQKAAGGSIRALPTRAAAEEIVAK